MAKAKKQNAQDLTNETALLSELMYHYQFSSNDVDRRKLRKNGWDDILRAYFGKLPASWPYLSQVTDPVIRTALIEKTSRMFAGKLRGTVVPREGNDAMSAKIMNALLDFQWDYAKDGGTMLEKIILMDIQTRLYGASFGLCYWDVKPDKEGKTFETNEFKVLDNRDTFVDYQSTSIENANWVQVREWVTYQQLKDSVNADGTPMYNNLDVMEALLNEQKLPAPQRRNTRYTSIIKLIRNLEDRVGQDRYYPTIEICTEYRRDRWITFAPRLGLIIRDIPNPYKNNEIPIVMLRYYPVGDDVYGESEVEAVLPLYRAINSVLCGFLDQINLAMRPPVKIANNAEGIRLDTIVYGPNALWLTGSSTANVMEHQSANQPIASFQTSYTAMKQALNSALGEGSQPLAPIGPFAQDKTATEITMQYRQTQSRDNYNQIHLEEFLKSLMMKWISNNQQFLFSDPTKQTEIIRIVGKQMIDELSDMGMADSEIPSEVVNETANLIDQSGGQLTPEELKVLHQTTMTPTNPVMVNGEVKPKLELDETKAFANLHITPDDLRGLFDYVPDVKSMALGVNEQAIRGRNQAFNMLLNPGIEQRVQAEGQDIKIVELLKQILEDNGVRNTDKLFADMQKGQPNGLPTNIGQSNTPGAGTIPTGPSITGTQANEGLPTPPGLPNQLTQMA
jgi:hypothetical protein